MVDVLAACSSDINAIGWAVSLESVLARKHPEDCEMLYLTTADIAARYGRDYRTATR
jgi:hypothetical protein